MHRTPSLRLRAPHTAPCGAGATRVRGQTINIWSHMLGAAACLVLLASHVVHERARLADVAVLAGYLTAAAVMHALSAAYHAQCATLEKRFFGISIFVAYSQAACVHYAFSCSPAWHGGYLATIAGLFASCVCMRCRSQARFARRFALVGAFGAVPLVHHVLVLRTTDTPAQRAALAAYLRAIAGFGVGSVLCMLKLPECVRPPGFEIVGSSYRWQHLCVLAGTFEYQRALQLSAHAASVACPLTAL